MRHGITTFLDRLTERLTALIAGLISARVASLHATVQAEQQSHLEDLARQYDADGKIQIASTLRERAARLTTPDLVSEATEVLQCVVGEPSSTTDTGIHLPAPEPRSLPEWTVPAAKPRGKRSVPDTPTAKHDVPEIG